MKMDHSYVRFLPFAARVALINPRSPVHERTSPVVASNLRSAIHRFVSANRVTICAVFLASPL